MLDEQRVAFGGCLNPHELQGCQRCLGQARDDLRDRSVGKFSNRDSLRAAPAQQPRKHGAERAPGVELAVPVRADDDHMAAADPLGEVAKEQDCGGVGPVQVVEHNEQRFRASNFRQEIEDGVEQLLAELVGANLAWGRHASHLLAQVRHELRNQRAVVFRCFLQGARCRGGNRGGKDLAEGRKRRAAFVSAAAAQDEPAFGRRFDRHLGGQARRSDSRLAAQEQHSAGPCHRAVEHHADVKAFLLAVDEAVAGLQYARCFLDLARRDLMQPPPVGEALQLVASSNRELHLRHGSDQLADDLRDEDLAAPGLTRNAGRDVDGSPEDVARLLHHLAGVEADADPDLSLRVLLAVRRDRRLNVERAFHAVPHGAEADHESVAEALDPAACVVGNLLVDDRLVGLHDLVRLGETSGREHPGRVLDVGEHDGHGSLCLTDRKAADDRLHR